MAGGGDGERWRCRLEKEGLGGGVGYGEGGGAWGVLRGPLNRRPRRWSGEQALGGVNGDEARPGDAMARRGGTGGASTVTAGGARARAGRDASGGSRPAQAASTMAVCSRQRRCARGSRCGRVGVQRRSGRGLLVRAERGARVCVCARTRRRGGAKAARARRCRGGAARRGPPAGRGAWSSREGLGGCCARERGQVAVARRAGRERAGARRSGWRAELLRPSACAREGGGRAAAARTRSGSRAKASRAGHGPVRAVQLRR